MPRNQIELERIELAEDLAEVSGERFDRMAFAERAVALVRPEHTTVAICEGARRVEVTTGRQWGREEEARWAVLRVPPNASRRAIARAVLGLGDFRQTIARTGEANGPYRGPLRGAGAWRLDVLVSLLGAETDLEPRSAAAPRSTSGGRA